MKEEKQLDVLETFASPLGLIAATCEDFRRFHALPIEIVLRTVFVTLG